MNAVAFRKETALIHARHFARVPDTDWLIERGRALEHGYRPIGNWDTGNVVDMKDMFEGASRLDRDIVRQFERRAIDAHMKAKSAESSTAREPYAKKPRSKFGARS